MKVRDILLLVTTIGMECISRIRRLFPLHKLPIRFVRFCKSISRPLLFRLLLAGFIVGALSGALLKWHEGFGYIVLYGVYGTVAVMIGAFLGCEMRGLSAAEGKAKGSGIGRIY